MKIHHFVENSLFLMNFVDWIHHFDEIFDYFATCPGGWLEQIKIKDQLSLAEAEIGAELGNKLNVHVTRGFFKASHTSQSKDPSQS